MKDAAQERLTAARRNQILDAAATIFAEKGFHPTTIRDIARAAGIADGTIYIYFENKPALLLGILDRMMASAQRNDTFPHLAEGDLRGFLRAYLRQPLLAPKADNFALFRVIFSEILVNSDLRERYRRTILEPTLATAEAHFQQWADRQTLRPVDIGLTVRAVSGIVMGLILKHIIGDTTVQERWDALPDVIADLILHGIAIGDATNAPPETRSETP